MNKRFLTSIFTIVGTVACAFGLTACGHTHEYAQIVTQPTCTEKGYTTFTCECGDSYVGNQTNALGHIFNNSDYVSDNNATYEANGTKTAVCSRDNCNETKTIEDVGSMIAKGLTYTLSLDGLSYSVARGTCSDKVIVLPSTYKSLPVTKIDDYGFYTSSSLESITIPESVTTIGNSAFNNCNNLKNVTISDSITKAGKDVFSNCNSLIYNEKNNLKYLGNENNEYSFLVGIVDKTVTSITVDDNCKIVAYGALSECNNVTEITLPFVGETKDSEYEYNVGYVFGVNTYYDSFKSLPETLNKVTITSANKIGENAFYKCRNLNTIIIPNTVESIGNYAFYECSALSEINLPSTVAKIGDQAFCDCNSLISVTIPTGVTVIEDGLFYSCDLLENVVIPEGVTSIGSSAFGSCKKLASISIPNSVKSIGCNAFSSCDALTYYETDDCKYLGNDTNNRLYLASIKDEYLTSITIDANTKIIGSSVFEDCSYLKSVIIPNGVVSIGEYAFKYSGIESITIPNSVIEIGAAAFECCPISSVTLPSGLTSISAALFYACDSLKNLEIPDSVTSIGNSVFRWSGITSIEIPDSVTSIGDGAFDDCDELLSVVIGSGVQSIGRGAFEYCDALSSITFSDTDGWYVTTSYDDWLNKTGGTLIDVTDAQSNATYFTDDDNSSYYFYKK